MKNTMKALVLSVAVAATALTATAGVSQARDRDGYWRDGGYREHRRHRDRDALIGGALGLATGVIIGGAIASQPRYDEPRYIERRYVEPEYYPEPERRVIYRPAPSYEPWTRSWYDYCARRYRSFDPQSGTFVGYDGREHFCTAG
ncbi:BA14K family protein [Shinella sp. AETb1-6]|jgi:hypothetical protein|uniref:Lectin-like protein BA14k n=2 Tax=Shinella TaxID=323620 RepID=A0AA50HFY0_9HYPH|nr:MULTISPECIES: BA14K family protein [Shinella]MDP9590876.1 hypothetical protein [Shinella zoogloeoides]MCD1263374.1 BA14K family protein [Shinella sumterensis]MXN49923.1 BA14K family protein [Shinella sp. AETb1-6]TFE99758.1 hypothetical protein B5M44_03500 [Shinella sumterensis]UPA23534.1 BA14K family protein [Shinella oryzae]